MRRSIRITCMHGSAKQSAEDGLTSLRKINFLIIIIIIYGKFKTLLHRNHSSHNGGICKFYNVNKTNKIAKFDFNPLVRGHNSANVKFTLRVTFISAFLPFFLLRTGTGQIVYDFRGLSISSSTSKVFELVIFDRFYEYFTTSDHQFGFFFKRVSRRHALYCVHNVLESFIINGSTKNMCALDLSKALTA